MIELGGFRVPSERAETRESFQGAVLSWVLSDPRDERLLLLVLLLDTVDVECRFLAAAGMPSHFEFTFGMLDGSCLPTKVLDEVGVVLPLVADCLRCCSANCSRASWEGSFRDRKPSTEVGFLFFFVLDDLESLEEVVALDVVEARLSDVRLAVSEESRELMDVDLESGEVGRFWWAAGG